jgi:hypothetical protein
VVPLTKTNHHHLARHAIAELSAILGDFAKEIGQATTA